MKLHAVATAPGYAGASTLTPMTRSDALWVCSRVVADERRQIEALIGRDFDAEAEAMRCTRRDTAYTIAAPDGERVMVGGFDLVHPRLARCWSLSTPRWGEHVRDITRLSRDGIERVLNDTEVHRMEILCSAGRTGAHHWYTRSLGFVEEAVLHCYGHAGEDFVLFARTTDAGLP
ncbi:MAG: hypothetical protein ACR2RL_21805 [Gammaproteobacteria bacterium]